MAKKKSTKMEVSDEGLVTIEKPHVIISAYIKDGMCDYGYEIKKGPGAGDNIPKRKGSAYVHDDMTEAFAQLDVHLAVIDDAFKNAHKQYPSLDEHRDDELTSLYKVTGIRITGKEENEGFILIGEKWVTSGSIGLETPKIIQTANYVFYEELVEAIENVRAEVEQYMNGKVALKQTVIDFPEGTEFDNPME